MIREPILALLLKDIARFNLDNFSGYLNHLSLIILIFLYLGF